MQNAHRCTTPSLMCARPACHAASVSVCGEAFDDLDVLLQGSGIVIPFPGNAIIAFDRRCQGPERYSGVGQFFDVLARQCDTQTLGYKGHQGGFQLGVLNNPRVKPALRHGPFDHSRNPGWVFSDMPTKNIVASSPSLTWRLPASGCLAGNTTTVLWRAMLSHCRPPEAAGGRSPRKPKSILRASRGRSCFAGGMSKRV